MGDATGVYTGMATSYGAWARLTNWNYCTYARPGLLAGLDDSGKTCYSQGDPAWVSHIEMYPHWNATQVCEANYVFDPNYDTISSSTWANFKNIAQPGMQMMSNTNLQEQRRTARKFRQSIMAKAKAAGAPGGTIATECKQIFKACHGQETCEYKGCVPEVLQYSCVPKNDFFGESTDGVAARVVTMFGSLKVRTLA
jgi:hypothetical protein